MRDWSEAEDAVQNAYYKAYRHIGQFHCDSMFSTWLTRIVINRCLMRIRQRRRARVTYLSDVVADGEQRVFELTDARHTPEQAFGGWQVSDLVRREVSRIPPLLRNAILLRDVNELPMPEVASRLGVMVAAAKSRLLRARAELRERMRKHCGRIGPATLTA